MSERPEVKAVRSNITAINSTITNGNGVQWYAQKLTDEEFVDGVGSLGLEDCSDIDIIDGPNLSSNTDPVAALAGKLTEAVVKKLITTTTPGAVFKKYLGILGGQAGQLVKQIANDYVGFGGGINLQSEPSHVQTSNGTGMEIVGPACNHLKLGDLPTLPRLLHFPSPEGKINILQRIGTNYNTFGILLLNDDTGDKVKAISSMHCGDASRINLDIFREWLAGKGKTPVTWRTLIDIVHGTDLTVLASDIRRVMCSCHTSAVK